MSFTVVFEGCRFSSAFACLFFFVSSTSVLITRITEGRLLPSLPCGCYVNRRPSLLTDVPISRDPLWFSWSFISPAWFASLSALFLFIPLLETHISLFPPQASTSPERQRSVLPGECRKGESLNLPSYAFYIFLVLMCAFFSVVGFPFRNCPIFGDFLLTLESKLSG